MAEKNRLSRASPELHPRIQDHIAWLKEELNDLDAGLRQKIRQSPVWREKDDLLHSVPGVGEQVSLTLLAELPAAGRLGPEADCRPGWCGPLQPGQPSPSRKANGLGRQGQSPRRPVHGSVGGHSL